MGTTVVKSTPTVAPSGPRSCWAAEWAWSLRELTTGHILTPVPPPNSAFATSRRSGLRPNSKLERGLHGGFESLSKVELYFSISQLAKHVQLRSFVGSQ